jgi:enoyl-CoA hydratase/carnithine racemase
MDYSSMRLEFGGGIARLSLNAGDGNRVDGALRAELRDAATTIDTREDVLVTLLRAEGNDFCRGWSPAFRDELAASRLDAATGLLDPFGPLAALRCPVVCAVQGQALSAGLELALTADVRIAAADARFGLPDVGEGRLPLGGGSQRLPRVVGRSRALAMLLGGEAIDAAAALRAGLVSRVVATDSLLPEAEALARRIDERGPIALRYAKEAVLRGLEMPLEQALRYETDLSIIIQTTADRAEGVRAFFEKRPPRFENR